jgi:hypothetical protein
LIPCAEALALATSDSIPESGHPQQPARDPPAELVVRTVGTAEPGAPHQEKRAAFTSSNLLKTRGNDPSAKKTSRRGTAITGEPLMHPSEEKGGFRHPLPRARTQ